MGCGRGTLASLSSTPAFQINGNVHGGAFPIQGATIRLMETQSNGVWSTDTHSYVGRAKQLMHAVSDKRGYFSFPNTGWVCDAGQYAYLTVTGGHTTASTNTNVVQVAVIGGCSTDLATTAEMAAVNVDLSELSTVAAAYALSGFLSVDDTNAASGEQIVNITAPAANNSATPGCVNVGNSGIVPLSCTHAGLAHAFANAYNLVDQVTYAANQFPTGTARTTLPNNPQALVPQQLLNTLGNILQSCVDTNGGAVGDFGSYQAGGLSSTHCGDLFYWATPPGSTTPPTDTLEAVQNMVRYPNNNVDALFNLQPRATFFNPGLTSDALSDGSGLMSFTLSIFYGGTGLPNDAGMPYPEQLALDANDSVYVAYAADNTGQSWGAVDALTSDGTGLFAGQHQASLANPGSLALDANGYLWATNDAAQNGNLFGINTLASGGTPGNIGATLAVPGGYAAGVAADMSNNLWVSRDSMGGQTLFRFDAANAYAQDPLDPSTQMGMPVKRLLVDYRQNVIGISSNTDNLGNALNSNPTSLFLLPYAAYADQATVNTAQFATGNGYDLATNQDDIAYIPLNGELDTEFGYSSGLIVVDGDGSYTGPSDSGVNYITPMGAQMDGAGNLFWPDFEHKGQLFWLQPAFQSMVGYASLTSFAPCLPTAGQCDISATAYLRGMAIDSSGALWTLADSRQGALIQTFGVAAPTYPLLAYGSGGVMIQ